MPPEKSLTLSSFALSIHAEIVDSKDIFFRAGKYPDKDPPRILDFKGLPRDCSTHYLRVRATCELLVVADYGNFLTVIAVVPREDWTLAGA
jgi:hypothetical protein